MEDNPALLGQKKTVDLDRGVFIVRYSGAEDEAFPPKVKIAVAPGSDESLNPILHPDEREAVLWQPGSGLVVQAVGAGQLLVEVTPTRAKGSASATVKIESLTQGKPPVEIATTTGDWEPSAALEAPVEQVAPPFRLLGHVAGRGDVFVNANEWIGGPSAPSRIEGIAIEWPQKPRDLTVRYAVRTARANVGSPAAVELGTFAGTRGRALPLVGVLIELSGPAAPDYELAAEAVFLGSPAVSANGQRVVLAGPTGREPLVGFRLRIEQIAAAPQPKASARAPKAPPAGRVRVFRSTGAGRG
jgi:hypothetical protein